MFKLFHNNKIISFENANDMKKYIDKALYENCNSLLPPPNPFTSTFHLDSSNVSPVNSSAQNKLILG